MLRCNLKNLRATIKTEAIVRGLVLGLCSFNFFLSLLISGRFQELSRLSVVFLSFPWSLFSTTDGQIAQSVYHVNMMSFYFYLMEKLKFSGQKFKGRKWFLVEPF